MQAQITHINYGQHNSGMRFYPLSETETGTDSEEDEVLELFEPAKPPTTAIDELLHSVEGKYPLKFEHETEHVTCLSPDTFYEFMTKASMAASKDKKTIVSMVNGGMLVFEVSRSSVSADSGERFMVIDWTVCIHVMNVRVANPPIIYIKVHESTSKRPYTYRILQLTPAEDEKDDGQHESPFKKPKKNVADAAMLPKFEKNKSYQDDSAEAVIPQQVAVSHMCQSSTVIGGVRIKIRHLLSSEPSDGSWYKTCVGCVGICRERYHISE